ncbi:ATP-binding cassette domain-containing protein [Treponema parvum]|uniref:ATP-binding cassette domain-containing protein n=1 Tax=Treponema parvum TaxID=138851 RepID=A0A975F0P2_9SPIR|nr:ATP-binding cassette domain-containing protein [Treponema parvum]QTQ12233.1 ATP-binding cassette domain-containing protein [Treponema parvum]QTQ15784.1 ATP-binding cassette domain-containing protein [Treponema parvum]
MTPVSLNNFSIHLDKRELLKDCSFSLEPNSSSVIMGPTGTGKSVFLKSIAGILSTKIFTFGGSMKVNDILAYDGRKLDFNAWAQIAQSGLMFVPAETAQVMNPALTLDQNLALLAPGQRTVIVERLKKYFSLDFEAFARLYPDEISGGEMQRITLMILLSRKGNLILLDEPTVNLDRNLRKHFVTFLNNEILAPKDKTFLMVSHDLDFIKRLTLDKAFMLQDGVIRQMDQLPEMEGYEKPEAKKGASGTAIELKDVSQTYFKRGIFGERTFTAFKGLNLKFERSTVYGLTGPSGCGKSTTIKAILRLLDSTKGQILMEDSDLVALKPKETGRDPKAFKPFRRRMTVVQQDSRFSFFPDLSIRDSFKQISAESQGGTIEELEKNLEKVGLTSANLDEHPYQLSSGEMKRMDIARALTAKPDILLLDEPFAHIDFETRLKVMQAISEYLAVHATILVIVTHEDFDLRYFVEKSFDFPELVGQFTGN